MNTRLGRTSSAVAMAARLLLTAILSTGVSQFSRAESVRNTNGEGASKSAACPSQLQAMLKEKSLMPGFR